MRRLLVTLGLSLALLHGPAAEAEKNSGLERYKVRKGDTLELLAAEYYGNRVHKIYIMVENGLDHGRPLKPGERLRIPISQRITTAAGDTLAGLAETHLGSAARAKYLAESNGLDPNTTLPLGQAITIPMRVRYRASGDVTLKAIALSLFADAKLARLLREYNELDSDELVAGQVISIPVPKVQVQASKRRPADADAAARASKRRDMLQRALQSIPRAQAAWRAGDFTLVKRELTKLELDYLDTHLATEAGVLLGATYIAFDDEDSALAAFAKVLQRDPDFALPAEDHSPKVRKLWQRASQRQP